MRQFIWMTAICLTGMSAAWAGGFAVGVSAGTLGLGAQASYGFGDYFALRGVVAGIDASVDFEAEGNSDLDYDGDAELRTALALLDYHPFAGGFRVTGGLVFGDSEIEGSATCRDIACEFGDTAGVLVAGDEARAEVDFGGTTPYLGIGWGSAPGEESGWAFSADLGAYLLDDPEVSVSISGLSATNPAARAEAEDEEQHIEDDLDDLSVYPVLMFGATYSF